MDRQHLTDKLVGGMPSAKDSDSRYEIYDASVENLAVRVGSKNKSFVLVARFGGPQAGTSRRTLGRFPAMTAEAARTEAHKWNEKLRVGVDPSVELEEARHAELRRLGSTFASVMEDYLAHLPNRKRNLRAQEDITFIRRNLLNPGTNPWMNKPISDVTDEDICEHLERIKARAPGQAFHCFRKLKTFFVWALQPKVRRPAALERNPMANLKASVLELGIGSRDRVFDYEEAYAYILTTNAFPYPRGPFLRALFETGQRIGVVSGMRWSQVNFERKLWTIPGTRSPSAQAGRTSKDESSLQLPLSNRMIKLLLSIRAELPPTHGDFVFSSTNGQTPVGNFSDLKLPQTEKKRKRKGRATGQFERHMNAILDELGYPWREPWVWHDVRRTVRTHLEPITGRQEIAEAAIGHGKTGIVRVYNLFKYRASIRRAFNAWSELLHRLEEGTCTIEDWEHDSGE